MGFKKNTFNVNFFVRQQKLLKNGDAPIYIRISVNNRADNFSIKRTVSIDHWNQTKESCTFSGKVGIVINPYIDRMLTEILKIHR